MQAREELSGEVGKVVAGQVGEVVAGQSGARKAEEENVELEQAVIVQPGASCPGAVVVEVSYFTGNGSLMAQVSDKMKG